MFEVEVERSMAEAEQPGEDAFRMWGKSEHLSDIGDDQQARNVQDTSSKAPNELQLIRSILIKWGYTVYVEGIS